MIRKTLIQLEIFGGTYPNGLDTAGRRSGWRGVGPYFVLLDNKSIDNAVHQ